MNKIIPPLWKPNGKLPKLDTRGLDEYGVIQVTESYMDYLDSLADDYAGYEEK